MDPLALKISYEFSLNPTKNKLKELHQFIENYHYDNLCRNKIAFLNCYLTEIRKARDFSVDCISELLFLLNQLKAISDEKLKCIILEDISNFIQNYTLKRSKNKSADDFSCVDIELAHNLLKIFKIIFTDNDNNKAIFGPSSLLLLSYIVAFLLFFSEYFKERHLENDSLLCLMEIVKPDTQLFTGNSSHKADIIVNFAPGIFQSLTKIIKADRKIGFSVKTKAIDCLSNLIVLIYGDQSSSVDSIDWSQSQYPEVKQAVLIRTDQWRSDTWRHVSDILHICKRSVLERSDDEHWRVRLALARMCGCVLRQCSCAGSSASLLIESLLVLSTDIDTSVSQVAHEVLHTLPDIQFSIPVRWSGTSSIDLVHSGALLLTLAVRDNIDSAIQSLANAVTSPGDDTRCRLLQVLDGYLSISVMKHLPPINCLQLNRIFTHLIALCKMDHSSPDLLESFHHSNEPIIGSGIQLNDKCEFFRKHFVHFQKERINILIQSILSHIISSVAPNLVLSILQSLGQDHPESVNTIILLTKVLLQAVISNDSIDSNSKITLSKTILSTYFDLEMMNLITTNRSTTESVSDDFWKDTVAAIGYKVSSQNALVAYSTSSSPSLLKQNTLTLALIMELCATCCLCFRLCKLDDHNDSWLMRICLFEVMNKAQQNPSLVSNAAINCLHILSTVHPKYCNSLSLLLQINADYIMDSVSRRLRSTIIMLKMRSTDEVVLMKTDAACRCLVTLCYHAEENILPFLQTILNQLLSCIDETHGAGNLLLITVLKEIVSAICRWRKIAISSVSAIEDIEKCNSEPSSHISIIRKFLMERNAILVSSGFRKEPEKESEEILEDIENESYYDDSTANNVEEKVELSPMTVAIQNIVDRCINLMSNSSGRIRLMCIEILNYSVYGLQRDNDILKIVVHKIWEPLEHRLWDKEYPVIIKAFELVRSISNLCGDFLYVKIKNGFVSKLCILLSRSAIISLSPTATMKYTGLYKLQIDLLQFISELSIRTSVHGYDLEEVVDAFLLYLDDRQPCELTSVCECSLMNLFKTDPGLVWFKVCQIRSYIYSNQGKNSSDIFGHVTRHYDSHYLSNTEKLLTEFDLINN